MRSTQSHQSARASRTIITEPGQGQVPALGDEAVVETQQFAFHRAEVRSGSRGLPRHADRFPSFPRLGAVIRHVARHRRDRRLRGGAARRGAVMALAAAVLAVGAGACGGGGGGASVGSSMTVTGPSGQKVASVTLTQIVDPARGAPGSGALLLQEEPGQKIVDLVFSVRALGSLMYQDTPRITLPAGPGAAYTTNGGNLSTEFTDSSSANGFGVLPHQTTTICVSFVVPTAFDPTTVRWVPGEGTGTSALTWSVPRAG